MKPSHRPPRDPRDPRWINRPESYGGYADSGDDDYPAAQQGPMREYSGHARPRPSGEEPGDSAGYARGYSREHTPGWGADGSRHPDDYRGRGPRRAAPEDDDLLDVLCERLAGDGDLDASEIEVSISEGVVVLAGAVPSRQARRDAEAIAESLRGVREVENRLRVEGKDTQLY
ncbi:BON domain-containing protein [Dyella sp. BiH032]|uniref:BON domain-containing protein n=1 Tax=Dyella sp. BiH032 TaxID=3075430 RepID=UPI002892EE7B|nr:BON domain-containing protein [Dyella sp. BiH032]WNL44105.1 BON domain-containing protein [Dyella sp. BiH032]